MDPPSLLDLRRSYEASDLYEPLRRFFKRISRWHEIMQQWENEGAPLDRRPPKLVRRLMRCIISRADVLATTPHASREKDFRKFSKMAKITFCDEAGAMTLPAVLLA
jgi:hypothetical protein